MTLVVGLLVVHREWISTGKRDSTTVSRRPGAELGPPADPANAYAAARPEWSLLGVYELANMFPGGPIPGLGISWKIVPIFVIPGVLLLFFLAMPFIARLRGGPR